MYNLSQLATWYRARSALVFGASGFIGRWVARQLSRVGANLLLVVRDKATALPLFEHDGIRGQVIEQDLRKREAVCRLLRANRPEVTFNLVGYGVDPAERCPEQAEQINVRLVQWIASALAELESAEQHRLVHVGSALEYGEIAGDLAEDSVPHPTTLYGRSKLAGTEALTRICQDRGVSGLTARLFMVYGPGEHPSRLFPTLCDAARTGQPVRLTTGEQQRDFTYVEDVAHGLLALGRCPAEPGTVVNLATGRLTRVRHFVETVARQLGIPREHLEFGALPTRTEEMRHAPVNIARLRALLDWVPAVTVAEGTRRTLDLISAAGQTASPRPTAPTTVKLPYLPKQV